MNKIAIDKNRCKGCMLCMPFCPKDLISMSQELNSCGYYFAVFNESANKCTACTFCAQMCPETGIEVYKNDKKNINEGK